MSLSQKNQNVFLKVGNKILKLQKIYENIKLV